MEEQTLAGLLVVLLSQLAMTMMHLSMNMVCKDIRLLYFVSVQVLCFRYRSHHPKAMNSSLNIIGLLRQPKWGHLKDLHRAIKLCEPALVSGDPTVTPLGNYQEVGFVLVSIPFLTLKIN